MAKQKAKVLIADCPECDTPIRFHAPLKVGQVTVCPECDERLEVRSLSPLELDWAMDSLDEEDDMDFDYDDEDDADYSDDDWD